MGTAMAKRLKSQEPDPAEEGKPKEDRSGRKTAPVQIDKDLAHMAAVIASYRGITHGAPAFANFGGEPGCGAAAGRPNSRRASDSVTSHDAIHASRRRRSAKLRSSGRAAAAVTVHLHITRTWLGDGWFVCPATVEPAVTSPSAGRS